MTDKGYFGVVSGTNHYLIMEIPTTEIRIVIFDQSDSSITYSWDFISTSDYTIADTQNLLGMSYDGSDTIYFVVKKVSDSKYYLVSYSISADTFTINAEYNVSLMLDRNTDTSNNPPFNTEKGFHLTSLYCYQIPSSYSGNLWKISDLTNDSDFSGFTLKTITDTYLIAENSGDTILASFQDMSNYIISAKIFHAERDYPTMELTYRSDELLLEEDMLVQVTGLIRVNASTTTDVRFEGYVIAPEDEDDEATLIKTVDLVNPSIYDLLKSYTGLLEEGGGDDWLDTLITSFNYLIKGTFDAATLTLPTLRRDSEKKNILLVDQLAAGESFTWRSQPKGILDWTNGADDSGINYDQDTPIWDVEVTQKRVRPNYIIVKGGYFGGQQIVSEDDHGIDLSSQQANGIIEQEFTIAWISTVALANSYADALINTIGATFTEVRFKVLDTTNGFIPPAEEITLAYTPKSIASAQYKINSVEFDDKTGIAEYVVSSIVRWDIEDLAGEFVDELADQVTQVYDRTMVKTGWDRGTSYSDCTISFSYPTFTLTLVADEMAYWIDGKKYTFNTNQTVNITDTEGVWFIYFDGETLTSSQTAWEISDADKALVSVFYWDATNNAVLNDLGWEFHSHEMSPIDHDREHHTTGCKYESGFALTEASDQITLTAGILRDEDIKISVTDGTGSGLFEQDLSPLSAYVFYKSGASNAWRVHGPVTYPFYDNATADNVHFNKNTAGTWSSQAATNTAKYINYWACGTSSISRPIFYIMGQDEYNTVAGALDVEISDLDLTGFPFSSAELKFLYKVIVKSDSSYNSTRDYRTVQTPGGVYSPPTNVISDDAFDSTWEDVTTIGASKNALYDKITAGIKRTFALGLNGANGATEADYFVTLNAVNETIGGGFYIDDNFDDSQDIKITMTWFRGDANNDTIAFIFFARSIAADGSEAASWNVENATAISLNACAASRFETYEYTLSSSNYSQGDVVSFFFRHNEAGRSILVTSMDVQYTSN